MPPKKLIPPPIEWVRNYQSDAPGNGVMHWSVLDSEGEPHDVLAPLSWVYKPNELRDHLRNHMADLPIEASAALTIVRAALDQKPKIPRIGLLTKRTGWLPEHDPKVFVLRDTTIGSTDVVHESRFARSAVAPSRVGSQKGWRQGLKKACKSSDWLVFSISVALAGPTLRFYPGRTGLLFNLAGESGGGKTSILMAAFSTISSPHGDAMSSTAITESGLEQSSLRSNDLVMCLDEFGAAMATPKQASSLIKMLSYQTREGRGKTRSDAGQKTLGYERASWCLSAITSSENTLEAMMGDEKREAGAMLRYVDIFVPNRDAGGAFPPLERVGKKRVESSKLAASVTATLKSNYGHALPAFVSHLMDTPDFKARLLDLHDRFIVQLQSVCPGLQSRFYEAFAKVYAAGCMAANAKVAPFNSERLETAIFNVFNRTTAVMAATSEREADDLSTLLNLASDAVRCPEHVKGQPVMNTSGTVVAVTCTHHRTQCMFVPSVNFSRLFPGRVKAVASLLQQAGVLKSRPGVAVTMQHKVDGLEAGSARISGYMIDLEKLRSLGAAAKK